MGSQDPMGGGELVESRKEQQSLCELLPFPRSSLIVNAHLNSPRMLVWNFIILTLQCYKASSETYFYMSVLPTQGEGFI